MVRDPGRGSVASTSMLLCRSLVRLCWERRAPSRFRRLNVWRCKEKSQNRLKQVRRRSAPSWGPHGAVHHSVTPFQPTFAYDVASRHQQYHQERMQHCRLQNSRREKTPRRATRCRLLHRREGVRGFSVLWARIARVGGAGLPPGGSPGWPFSHQASLLLK